MGDQEFTEDEIASWRAAEKARREREALDGWEPPTDFAALDLPPFPIDALPPVLRNFARAESEFSQTPVDMAAMLSLAACAAAIGKSAVVEVKPGYQEPINLFVAVVLPPGERKSAVLKNVTAPITEWEQKETERLKPAVAHAAMKVRTIEKQIDQQIKNATKAKNADHQRNIEAELEQLAARLSEQKAIVAPRILVDDTTPEALVSLMAQSGGRGAQFSAEGGVFQMLAGRYSDKVNLDAYLKGHAGDDIRVDRKGRPSEYVPSPSLTLGLAVQPRILESFADNPQFRGVGLLARFLYSLPTSKLGAREVDTPCVPQEVHAAYQRALTWMLSIPSNFKGHVFSLKMNAEALARHFEFARWVEPQLAEFAALEGVRDWASKLSGATARIAGILSILRISAINNQSDLNHIYIGVNLEAIEQAIAIGKYLVAHAQAAFLAMGMDERLGDAKAALRYIQKRSWQTFTRRDIQQQLKGTTRFKDPQNLDIALNILEQRHFIRPAKSDSRDGAGRKPSPAFEVNPFFLSSRQNSQNAQNEIRDRQPGEDDD